MLCQILLVRLCYSRRFYKVLIVHSEIIAIVVIQLYLSQKWQASQYTVIASITSFTGYRVFKKLFLLPGSRILRPGFYTICTIFGRMPGFEPELLQLQPGVLPMSYTHLWGNIFTPLQFVLSIGIESPGCRLRAVK